MKTNRQRTNRFTLVGLSTLLIASSVLGVFFPLQGQVDAAPIKKNIPYTAASGIKPLPTRTSLLLGKVPTTTTETISEDAGAGNKIQKIVFYKGTTAVKTINVDAQTYSGKETFTGEALPVLSKENGSAGSWMAWSRGILSTEWTAGNEFSTWTEVSDITPAATEPITTTDSGVTYNKNYKKAPYKEVRLKVKYARTQNFVTTIGGTNLSVPKEFIDDRANTLRLMNPSTPSPENVTTNNEASVTTGNLDIDGTNHYSTHIESILVGVEPNGDINAPTRSLDYATIQFTQKHDLDTAKYYLRQGSGPMVPYEDSNPKAQAMAFYYAAYSFNVHSNTYQYPDKYWVYTEDGGPDDPDEPIHNCTIRDGRVIEGEKMTPEASAVIKADQRDQEIFDVLQGIPTSESLYGNVIANNYLHQYKFKEQLGTCVYDVTVSKTYNLTWTEKKPGPANPDGTPGADVDDPKSDSETVQYPVHIEREFSYWIVDKIGIYEIDQAELKNYAFQGESITIQPAGYIPPTLSVTKDGKYVADPGPGNWTAPSQAWPGTNTRPTPPNDLDQLAGETDQKIKQVKVNNDTVVFNGQTLMDGSVVDKKTQDPKPVPDPQKISRDVLYKPNQMIPMSKTNRMSAPSMGTITYKPLSANHNAPDGDTYPIGGINPVTVHTPVVNYSSASDDAAHNQKTTPNYSRQAFILDRPFTITMPTSGQHQNYPGYGNRDYAKYYRSKEVYFPFDTYSGDRSTFYPKNTWINIPVGQITTEFFLPVWVDEGDYTVYYRNIAENAPGVSPTQQDANFDLAYHVASDTVDVEVIGRLYDFHLTDIADYNWEMVFRTQSGSQNPSGNSYWTGLNSIDGAARGNAQPYTLPILPGKNPLEGKKNVSIKTGYHVKFDLKTKGNMFGRNDGLRITPSFMFVSRDGKTKTPVDLYYNDDHRTFIKVGSPEDTEKRYVILNDRLRNVPEEELTDTARYKYDHYYGFAEMNGVSEDMFIADYIRRFTKEKTPIGGFSLMLLPEQIRTLIGPKTNIPAGVDNARANAAIQKWYGQYALPGDPYVVVKGTNLPEYGRTHGGLTKRDPVFLKDGYIILNFNIESIRSGNTGAPHLQYINAPLMNQWQMEGFNRTAVDSWNRPFALQDGDVAFFNADKSYKDDFESQVTH
ncbi:DUF5704 domain-containing protein [Saccharibacillus qingshengii]|uniref:DUF5704 domain-containing protein n=1 Tax=Saccharibacillus qingshengii TaxID=1763540 RepID=UPI0015552435|nr:DUF5704 domain-containing protein [Saccharibacillus qingshengii]